MLQQKVAELVGSLLGVELLRSSPKFGNKAALSNSMVVHDTAVTFCLDANVRSIKNHRS